MKRFTHLGHLKAESGANMNKKSKTLYISFLPILVLAALIVGAGYFLTEGEIKLPGSSNRIEVKRLEGFPREILKLEEAEKIREVIKSQEELDAFLQEIDPTGLTKVDEDINFNRYWAIGVSTGTLDVDGNNFKIKRVYDEKEENKLLVSIELEEPSENCNVEEAKNIWADLVLIKHTEKEIDFERQKREIMCDDDDSSEENEKTEDDAMMMEEDSMDSMEKMENLEN